MNKILIVLVCLFGIMIYIKYRKYHVITYDANSEYKIAVNSSYGCSYIIWFNIKTWNNGKKILFKKTDVNNKEELIIFIGDLTNDIYIYSNENSQMIPYNNCSGTDSFGKLKDNINTFADCKTSCLDNTSCVGFTLTDVDASNTDDKNKCYISENVEDIFKSSNCLFSELKLIKINDVPLQSAVKLAITLENNNMIVYINDRIIKSFFLKTTISPGTITVTPIGYGFIGFTYFKYFAECLNHEKIKKYSIKL